VSARHRGVSRRGELRPGRRAQEGGEIHLECGLYAAA
jgi:hypothetical protein